MCSHPHRSACAHHRQARRETCSSHPPKAGLLQARPSASSLPQNPPATAAASPALAAPRTAQHGRRRVQQPSERTAGPTLVNRSTVQAAAHKQQVQQQHPAVVQHLQTLGKGAQADSDRDRYREENREAMRHQGLVARARQASAARLHQLAAARQSKASNSGNASRHSAHRGAATGAAGGQHLPGADPSAASDTPAAAPGASCASCAPGPACTLWWGT